MPRVNPEISFTTAARHLFRHIRDEKALHANPLLRSYFDRSNGHGASVLAEIHTGILQLAEVTCRELTQRGRGVQAQRRREIVAALCAGESTATTALRLKLSRCHYYRERSAICSSVARALKSATSARDTGFVVGDDPLRLLFRRAESLRDGGCSSGAVKILEDAYARAADEFLKSALGLQLAEELYFLGCHERARELLVRSRASQGHEGISAASSWVADMWVLNSARLDSQLGRGADAGYALETLAKCRLAEGRSDDATFDAVFLTGEWYRNAGRYEEAQTMLRNLRSLKNQHSQAVAKRQIAIGLLTAYCVERSSDEFGLAERSLRDALELSIAHGTVIGALLAISGLIDREVAAGRDEAVYAMAHEGLRMAENVDFGGFLGYVTAQIGGAVLQTRYWRAAAPLVFDAEKLTAPGTLGRALLKRAQGALFARTGRRREAAQSLLEALAMTRELGNRKLEGLVLRDRALAFSGPSLSRQRSELMQEAVALIEQYGTASDIKTSRAMPARSLVHAPTRVESLTLRR